LFQKSIHSDTFFFFSCSVLASPTSSLFHSLSLSLCQSLDLRSAYGFVTYADLREAEAALRKLIAAGPVIDGKRFHAEIAQRKRQTGQGGGGGSSFGGWAQYA
jgi:hypothetical protein